MRAARGGGRLRAAALALVVGVVLADSSVVILALPDVLAEFDARIEPVTWVITAFNLVLAAAAVPAAYLSRRVAPAHACVGGLVVFAAACVGCAAAGSLDMLIAARCVQALGGALAVCAALELLPADTGGERRAAAVWTAAGAVGAAIGPAAGGILTEAISWQAIFLAQVPLALAPAAALLRAPAPTERAAGPAGRPHLAANAALALVSAALAAALFLLVLLLVEGWGRSPIAAAAVVSVMPLAALAVYRAVGDIGSPAQRAAAGAIAIAGGLAALGLLPGGSWAWTLLPQVLVGAGLALAVAALTDAALHGRAPQAIHGGWTIAARHAGVVLGLVLLTPLFTADLDRQQRRAELAGTAVVLDSSLPLERKLSLGAALARQIEQAEGEVPNLGRAFAEQDAGAEERPELARVERALDEQVRRAATAAFSRAFLLAAALALLALVPVAVQPRRVTL